MCVTAFGDASNRVLNSRGDDSGHSGHSPDLVDVFRVLPKDTGAFPYLSVKYEGINLLLRIWT